MRKQKYKDSKKSFREDYNSKPESDKWWVRKKRERLTDRDLQDQLDEYIILEEE